MKNELEINRILKNDFDIKGQAQNIISNISEAFEKAVKKGTEKIDFPNDIGEFVKERI